MATGLPQGAATQLIAIALFSNGGTSDVTSARATWSVDGQGLATVVNGRVIALAPGTVHVTASVGGVSGQATVTIPDVAVTSIVIAPDPITATVGGAARLTASAKYEDGSAADVSSGARWSIDDRSIAAVTASLTIDAAILTGLAAGTTTVHATLGRLGGPMTVGSASVTVTPP
jgi:hypothetical protein